MFDLTAREWICPSALRVMSAQSGRRPGLVEGRLSKRFPSRGDRFTLLINWSFQSDARDTVPLEADSTMRSQPAFPLPVLPGYSLLVRLTDYFCSCFNPPIIYDEKIHWFCCVLPCRLFPKHPGESCSSLPGKVIRKHRPGFFP